MTRRQPKNSVAGKLEPADNEWIEERAIAELEKLPTSAWVNMTGLWRRLLPALSPSKQRRILGRVVELAVERGDSLPAKFLKRIAPQRSGCGMCRQSHEIASTIKGSFERLPNIGPTIRGRRGLRSLRSPAYAAR